MSITGEAVKYVANFYGVTIEDAEKYYWDEIMAYSRVLYKSSLERMIYEEILETERKKKQK